MKYQLPALAMLVACLFIFSSAASQIPPNIRPKLQGLLPLELLREPEVYFGTADLKANSPAEIPVIVEVSSPDIFSEIEQLGGSINTREGNLATLRLPKKSLAAVAGLPGVIALEFNKVAPQNDLVRQHTRANLVQQGLSPLPEGYSGAGVIVGVVDCGIDFRHPDFRDPVGPSKSRILAIWDQTATNGTPPPGFSYGSLWTKSQIEAELGPNPPKQVNPTDDNPYSPGHGTHVSGMAAGNKGMAPEADIVFVKTDFSFNGNIDGVKFLRDFAKQAGQPCVVNLSLGTSLGNHEGNTNMSKLIDNLLTGTEQFSVVAAAGNNSGWNAHWGGFDLNNDTAIWYTGMSGDMLAWFRVPKAFGDSLQFSVGVDSANFDFQQGKFTGGTKFLGATPWTSVKSLTDHQQWFFHPNGDTAGVVQIYWQSNFALPYYPILVYVADMPHPLDWYKTPDEMDVFRFMFRGTGSFHGWLEGLPLYVIGNPGEIGLPEEFFRPSDDQFGILSPADGKNIVAVGAYVNRPSWTDLSGDTNYFLTEQAAGELADFSSHGPTFDGRQKPEICAPGKHVISAYPTYWAEIPAPLPFFSDGDPLWMLTGDSIHACYSGTSMASPAVAGCVALLLDAKPDLTFSEIRDLLTSTALTDTFTDASGSLPNGLFGYGKIDIFSAVMAALGLSETENSSQGKSFSVFPNPASEALFIHFNNASPSPEMRLRLLDAQGKPVFEKTGVSSLEILRTADFPTGVYFLEILDKEVRAVDKVLIFN